ncbi:MAG: Transcription factor WhiB [Frankiales bacterium]|jgi:WhiB family redox-sensing transcriptional regulator|nr:Transcription factor WhiB [Frankiales bacterium]
MAEVSWLSDYVGASERSTDRLGAGAGQGFAGQGFGAPALGGQAFGGPGFGGPGFGGGQGIAGFLGIGLEADAQSWQERALCAETDPEAFFPEKGGSTREAKKICTGCEVRAECLEYALSNDERFGIWGGLSERERRRLRRRAV